MTGKRGNEAFNIFLIPTAIIISEFYIVISDWTLSSENEASTRVVSVSVFVCLSLCLWIILLRLICK